MSLATVSGLADFEEQFLLNDLKTNGLYLGLITSITSIDTGTTGAVLSATDGVEMTTTNGTGGYSSYARQTVTWGAIAAATGDSTGQQIGVATPSTVTWPQNTGGSSIPIAAIGVYDALTAGHLRAYIIPTGGTQVLANNATPSAAASTLLIQCD